MSHLDDEMDRTEEFERHDEPAASALPLGWVILFVGLILWGAYYLYAYTPMLSGWTQEKAFEQSINSK